MNVIATLGYYLAHLSSSQGTIGVDIILGQDIPKSAVRTIIYDYTGQPPQETFGNNIGVIDMPSVQIVTRAGRLDYPTAKARAEAVRTAFGLVSDLPLTDELGAATNDGKIMRVQALGSVFSLGNDDNDCPKLACNFSVFVERA